MIDRVARAMCIADGMNPDHLPNEDYADGHEVQWMLYRNMAKAAIGAMREPTTEMYEAGQNEVSHFDGEFGDYNVYFSAQQIDLLWPAMIDAALNPPANT